MIMEHRTQAALTNTTTSNYGVSSNFKGANSYEGMNTSTNSVSTEVMSSYSPT